MDYVRIYDAFIKDRRLKEPQLVGYTERHHILPRYLGGGNGKSNIIRLSAEDHFFAHLLLAKIHGGRMWAPIAFMVNGSRKHYKPIQSRKYYGWASRAMAKANAGRLAQSFIATIHEIKHSDGRRWSGVQFDMTELGISKPLANMLIKGRIKSAKGWSLLNTPQEDVGQGCRKLDRHPMYRAEILIFRHIDGRIFKGTQFEFRESSGVSKSAACNLARGKVSTANGWFLDGTKIVPRGKAARWLKAS